MPIIRGNVCPCCGYFSDAATAPEDKTLLPEEGDLSICIKCAEFLQYGKDLVLLRMPETVLDDIDQESLDGMLEMRRQILGICL